MVRSQDLRFTAINRYQKNHTKEETMKFSGYPTVETLSNYLARGSFDSSSQEEYSDVSVKKVKMNEEFSDVSCKKKV